MSSSDDYSSDDFDDVEPVKPNKEKELSDDRYMIEVFDEIERRTKAVKDAVEAIRKNNETAIMRSGILRCDQLTLSNNWEVAEAESDKMVEELEKELYFSVGLLEEYKKKNCGLKTDPLKVANEQQQLDASSASARIMKITDCDTMVKELGSNMHTIVDLLHKYNRKRAELQTEHEESVKRRKKQMDASLCPISVEFPLSEIEEATENFSPLLMVEEGHYASVYHANLRHNRVTIKVFKSSAYQSPLELRHAVDALSKLSHPNLVKLIGACLEAQALVYEYVPNVSLESRLIRKDNNNNPLSWKTRISIASDLCSSLIFLHSLLPVGIVHGNLNPSSILLDPNDVCRLIDFGVPSLTVETELTDETRWFGPGSLAFIDPLVVAGQATTWSDVYSFGSVLLLLLSGKPPGCLFTEVRPAMKRGNLKDVLDPNAGNWPLLQMEPLARIAVECSSSGGRSHPNQRLSEAWKVLQSIKASCGISGSD